MHDTVYNYSSLLSLILPLFFFVCFFFSLGFGLVIPTEDSRRKDSIGVFGWEIGEGWGFGWV